MTGEKVNESTSSSKEKETKKDGGETAKEGRPKQGETYPSTVDRVEYEKLVSKVGELEGLKDQMLRSAADFENAKKRLAKDREEFSRYALESLFYDLLPVLDNFERALSHQDESKNGLQKSVWSGIELIHKQLVAALRAHGLARMEVLKKPFDPHLFEAVGHVESDGTNHGTVAEDVLTGYQLHGKILRPAKVKVFQDKKKSDEGKEKETQS